jgi:hypothetical protein
MLPHRHREINLNLEQMAYLDEKILTVHGFMKNSPYYIASAGRRTPDLLHPRIHHEQGIPSPLYFQSWWQFNQEA